jgi:hypothetical protein
LFFPLILDRCPADTCWISQENLKDKNQAIYSVVKPIYNGIRAPPMRQYSAGFTLHLTSQLTFEIDRFVSPISQGISFLACTSITHHTHLLDAVQLLCISPLLTHF